VSGDVQFMLEMHDKSVWRLGSARTRCGNLQLSPDLGGFKRRERTKRWGEWKGEGEKGRETQKAMGRSRE